MILATHVRLAPVGRSVKALTGARLYVFVHGVEAWRPLHKATNWGLAGADAIVTNSAFTLQRFREHQPRFAGLPGFVCHLPARRLGDVAPPDRTDADGRPLRVLVIGRLTGRGMLKGQRQLIELWPAILKEFPGAELWIVGDGDGRSTFESLARDTGVAHAVRFPGAVPDAELSALYASADVYAMPSEGEGFGLVFAEAMAHGVPCIASRFDGGSEVVVDGETGLLVDPANRGEILGALRTLLRDEPLRARMGRAGRTRAAAEFSLAAFNERVQSLLRGNALGGAHGV